MHRQLLTLSLLGTMACSASESTSPGGSSGGQGGSTSSPSNGGGGSTPSDGVTLPGDIPRPDAGPKTCASVEAEAEPKRLPADVIWEVDNSGSESVNGDAIQAAINKFATRVLAKKIDLHLVLISYVFDPAGDPPIMPVCVSAPFGNGETPAVPGQGHCKVSNLTSLIDNQLFQRGIADDTKEPSFFHYHRMGDSYKIWLPFIDTFNDYKHVLRPQATKTFVATTDDDPAKYSAIKQDPYTPDSFIDAINKLDPQLITKWTFTGMWCPAGACPAGSTGRCLGESKSVEEVRVKTSGPPAANFCDSPNFDPLIETLSNAVITGAGIQCEWDIPKVPDNQTFDKGKVNVLYQRATGPVQPLGKIAQSRCGTDKDGWYYDNENTPTKVLVCPKTCDVLKADTKGNVKVQFSCSPSVEVPR